MAYFDQLLSSNFIIENLEWMKSCVSKILINKLANGFGTTSFFLLLPILFILSGMKHIGHNSTTFMKVVFSLTPLLLS